MTKQEQIEEMCEAMASMICEIYNPECDKYKPYTCSHCYANSTLMGDFAEMLIDAGYGKVDEVRKETAKEFAEKVKMAFYYEFDEIIPSIMGDKIDELLKEYEVKE